MIERRSLAGGVTALIESDLEREGVLVAFTERSGGLSEGIFHSLNLSLTQGDAPERVAANRRAVTAALGIERFTVADQVHGSNVAVVDRSLAGAGFEDRTTALSATDAMVTTVAGLALAVLAADCVPVALASVTEGRVAVVHAGWRGLAAGIVPATLRSFDEAESVHAVVGPAVGSDHYEVGEDVALAVDEGSVGGVVVSREGARPRIDLGATVVRTLGALGVGRIDRLGVCTACEPSRFFSHRRDGPAGRQALVAVRRANQPGRP